MVGWKKRIIFSLSLFVTCYSLLEAAEVSSMRYVMGTLLQIEVIANDESIAESAVQSAFSEVERLDGLLSNYKEDSEISRINREAYPNGIETTGEIANFLLQAKMLSELTSGYFDITIEPLTRLWKVREGKLERMPTQEEIEATGAKVNYKNLEVSTATMVVRFLREGMGIDTAGIGKGYALDKALEKIKQLPLESCTLNFGGQILFWSTKSQKRKVAIKNPLKPGKVWKTFSLTKHFPQLSVSSSGNYERFVTRMSTNLNSADTFGHILNPKTGMPSENEIRSVSVVSPFATVADALSTGIFVMDLKQGKKFSGNLPFTGVLLLYENEKKQLVEMRSEGWEIWLKSKPVWPGIEEYISAAIMPLQYIGVFIGYLTYIVANALANQPGGYSVGVGKK